MHLAVLETGPSIWVIIGTVCALSMAINVLADKVLGMGRRKGLEESFQKSITEALEHQSEEFEKAIEKLETDRVTNDQLQLLVARMEQGFQGITREFAGFAGRAGIIGDIEYLKKAQAEGFEIQNRARHDLRDDLTGRLAAMELRVKRCEDHMLGGG